MVTHVGYQSLKAADDFAKNMRTLATSMRLR
jgi:hypothetical protein